MRIGKRYIHIRIRHKKAWKIVLFWILLLKLLTYMPFPPTRMVNATVSGVIPRDMIWSNKVYIAGDVFIPKPFRVEVEPGTQVLFMIQDRESAGSAKKTNMTREDDPTATHSYEKTHSSLVGTVIANGALFTSASPVPQYADWSELVLFNGSMLNDSIVEYTRGGVILLEGNITIINSTSRYALWNCFEDRTGGVFKNVVANNCWHNCMAILTNGTTSIDGGKLSECYKGLNLTGKLLSVEGIEVRNSCIPLEVSRKEDKQIKLFNKFMLTKPTAEGGVFEGRLIYPSCPESTDASD